MKRDIEALSSQEFDIVIVGGGISGACIAWDAITRGLKVALIERKDFGHATSMATSKLIHGGLRYLAQYQFGVVRESLRERRFFEKNLPHLIFPLGFLLPIYDFTPTSRFLLGAGLTLYDLLAYDKNELSDPDKHLANHKWLSKEKALEVDPNLNPKGLKGAFYYYDGLNRLPERTNMEFITSSAAHGAVIANYTEAVDFLKETASDTVFVKGIRAKDLETGKEFDIHAKVVINASGPWGDLVLSKLHKNPVRKIIRSKGIHLIFPKFGSESAITFETKDKHHFFIIPWLNYSLIGTTDTPFEDDPDNLKVTRKEAEDFMQLVNDHYPAANLTYDKILHAYAGIRPLVADSESTSTYEASRKHEIVDHNKLENVYGLISVFGGKYTTSRSLAEETINHVVKEYGLKANPCVTKDTPLDGGNLPVRFSIFLDESVKEYGPLYGEQLVRNLVYRYGVHFTKILNKIKENPEWKKPLEQIFYSTPAEIEYAISEESALHLDDLLLRRIGLGNTGEVNQSLLEKIATQMGHFLGWDKSRIQEEVSHYQKTVRILD
ncbi:MAG: glycerol-3-phosphate dehydrogenase/oxidase [Candidatus Hydrogenedentota bacterium]|nr:MAG: glycerol-3-phosphate dehydrogenase/oxidase [Candidatus Hydrogenedentota bacterium]